MSVNFEELDFAETRFGELILRRRRALSLGGAEIYEVKLDGSFLMSSLVNESEIALSELGLAALETVESEAGADRTWDVVVGGLGLGYTAAAALDHPGLRTLLVVEYLPEVISWHRRGLVPIGERLCSDPRARLEQGDFFALAADPVRGFDRDAAGRRFHAVLLDIDHAPGGLLHASHAGFYEKPGLIALAAHLHPGGVFALWSSEAPDDAFSARLDQVFEATEAHAVTFCNPLLDRDDTNAVYVCRTKSGPC